MPWRAAGVAPDDTLVQRDAFTVHALPQELAERRAPERSQLAGGRCAAVPQQTDSRAEQARPGGVQLQPGGQCRRAAPIPSFIPPIVQCMTA